MVNFRDAALRAKVQSFQNEFAAHTQLITYGQFYVTNRLIDMAVGTIQSAIASDVLWALVPEAVKKSAIQKVKDFFNGPPSTLTNAALSALATGLNLPQSVQQLAVPSPSATNEVQQLYTSVWGTPDIGAGPPWFSLDPTMDRIRAASAYEQDKCYPVLQSLAGKLLRARGVSTTAPASRISQGQIAGATVSGVAAGSADPVPQQTIQYSNTVALGVLYGQMTSALVARSLVRCGVLSGASHERSTFPTPEHYVLAFDWALMDGQLVFLCWDPDSFRSNIEDTKLNPTDTLWGPGFTCLFALPDRLSTAFNAGDLIGGVERHHGLNFGDHFTSPRRHAYQVYHLQTLPA